MNRRRLATTTAIALLFVSCYPLPARAVGIPVIDAAALTELITSVSNQIKAYGLQLEGYLVQAKQWATQNLQWLQQIQSMRSKQSNIAAS